MRLRRKFSFLRVFTVHGKAGKSKKFICQAWIVMELDWPPWKLLVNENSVIEIRYCRCQRKEIACMIEMKNHGTNLIEKQSLCLFDWSTLKRKPIPQGKFWEKFTVTASKVIEKVMTFEDLKRVQDWCELSIWQMTEIKSDKYQAMPTWSYQCQRVWILLDDFFNVQVYNCTFGGPPPQPSQLIDLSVGKTSAIFHGSI